MKLGSHTHYKKCQAIVLLFLLNVLAMPCKAQGFLNGSFENNSAGLTDRLNLSSSAFNAYMTDVNSFGTFGNLDIIFSTGWGGSGAQHQSAYIALTGGGTDAMAMTLSAPLVAGTTYTISFWDRKDPGYNALPVQISLATSSNSLGTLIYTAPPPVNNTWTQRVFTFTAPNNGQYVIVTQSGASSTSAWVHVDNFELVCTAPTLTVSPSATVCAGAAPTLTVSGGGSYTWTPAAGLSATSGSMVVASPASTSTYSVTSVIGTCTRVATVTLSVSALPSLSISPNPTVCAGSSATLTVSGASSYTWMPGNISGNKLILSPLATESYTIHGSVNSCTASVSTTLTVVPLPVIATSPDADICLGTTINLSATGASGYSWSPSAGLSSATGPLVNASPGATTIYTITGTTSGCSSTASVTVRVSQAPPIFISASPASVCRNETSFLTASGASSYSWSPGAWLNAVNGSQVQANPSQTTTYTVIGISGSCTATGTVEVVVKPETPAAAIKFGDVCPGGSTMLQAQGGTSYHWLPVSGIANATAATTSVKPSVTTVYTVSVGDAGLCTATATVEVNVNPAPHVFAGNDTTINIGESIVLMGTGDVPVGFLSPASSTLACNFCDAITVSPQESTCYILKGENEYGCMDLDTVCVYVTKDFEVYIPDAFTPNDDGMNDVFIPVGYGIEAIRLTIFDRWGAQLFTSNETDTGWNGFYQGKICEQGIYVYTAEIKTMAGHTVERIGRVALLPK